jgi:hypothetical protein
MIDFLSESFNPQESEEIQIIRDLLVLIEPQHPDEDTIVENPEPGDAAGVLSSIDEIAKQISPDNQIYLTLVKAYAWYHYGDIALARQFIDEILSAEQAPARARALAMWLLTELPGEDEA